MSDKLTTAGGPPLVLTEQMLIDSMEKMRLEGPRRPATIAVPRSHLPPDLFDSPLIQKAPSDYRLIRWRGGSLVGRAHWVRTRSGKVRPVGPRLQMPASATSTARPATAPITCHPSSTCTTPPVLAR